MGGDFLQRLVARTLAQQLASCFDEATRPHQFVLATRAGEPSTSILSVDGIGVFDLISRQAMLQELRRLPGAAAISTGAHPGSCGLPTMAWDLSFNGPRGASRATPSCPPCLHWESPQPCRRCRQTSVKASTCTPCWMTLTCPHSQAAQPPLAHAWRRACMSMPTFASTPARHECGTLGDGRHQACPPQLLPPTFGLATGRCLNTPRAWKSPGFGRVCRCAT